MVKMTERERRFYKEKMKKIRRAIKAGNEAEANRHANELKAFFGIR